MTRRVAPLVLAFVLVLVACPAGADPVPTAAPSGSSAAAAGPPGAEACPVFPADNVWHSDVRTLPVHSRSAAWLTAMGSATKKLHPDFGPSGEEMPYGIPYEVVPGDHAKVNVSFLYDDESDPGPYPFDADTPIELGDGDEHALMLDKDGCILYELYDAHYAPNGQSDAGSGAIFDLKSNALRPAGWTSADAAGLPVFAGLVRLDEVQAGVVDHAIRVTASRTDRSYVWPARHQAGAATDPNLPPMGARFRLKSSYDISGFRSDTRAILTAMQTYGLIVADNGSDWFFTGTAEDGWSEDMLDELKSVPANQFEAVDASSLMVSPDSGQVRTTAPPPPTGPTIAVKDFAFSPTLTNVTRGARVTWRFDGPSSHTATDNTGMTLYNSGTKAAGTTFAFTFTSAGKYAFRCTLHSGMTGTISVPIGATPSTGSTSTTFTVTWASAGPPPPAFAYDVQIRTPNSASWTTWRSNATSISATYLPAAGPGTYRFRSRVERLATGKTSAWSNGAFITVS